MEGQSSREKRRRKKRFAVPGLDPITSPGINGSLEKLAWNFDTPAWPFRPMRQTGRIDKDARLKIARRLEGPLNCSAGTMRYCEGRSAKKPNNGKVEGGKETVLTRPAKRKAIEHHRPPPSTTSDFLDINYSEETRFFFLLKNPLFPFLLLF